MSDRMPTAERLRSIADALRTFLETVETYRIFLDDEPTADAGTFMAMSGHMADYAALEALGGLERILNPQRIAWGVNGRVSVGISNWPPPVSVGLVHLHETVDHIIKRWNVPEICDDRPLARGTVMRLRSPTDQEMEQLGWCLNAMESALGWDSAVEQPVQAPPLVDRKAVEPPAKRRTRKGRPRSSDPDMDRRIFEAWETDGHSNLLKLANAFGITENEARKAKDRHRKRLEKNGKNSTEMPCQEN